MEFRPRYVIGHALRTVGALLATPPLVFAILADAWARGETKEAITYLKHYFKHDSLWSIVTDMSDFNVDDPWRWKE